MLNEFIFYAIFIVGEIILDVSIGRYIKGIDFMFFASWMANALYGFPSLSPLFAVILVLVHVYFDKEFVYVFALPFMPAIGGLIFGSNFIAFWGVFILYSVCIGVKKLLDALYANRGSAADAFLYPFVNLAFTFLLFTFVAPLLFK